MTELAKRLDGIPLVSTTAQRAVEFPTPSTGQRVQNLETGAIERYTGSAWVPIAPSASVVSVDAEGAVGDGSTDDSAAIQAAFNAAADGEVVFGPKTYIITQQIEVTRPALIRGAGRGATILRATTLGASNAIFKVTSSNVKVQDMTLRGPSVASYVADECGVWAYGTSGTPITDVVVENVEVYDIGSYGLLFEYANRARAVRNYVHDVGYGGIANLSSADFIAAENVVDTVTPGTSSNAYGLFASKRTSGDTNPIKGSMSKNVVRNVAIWEGIDTHGATHYTINDNIVWGCKIGIQVGPYSTTDAAHFTTISGNVIARGGLTTTQRLGISVGGLAGTYARGIVIKGNSLDTMGGADAASDNVGAILVQYTIGSVTEGNTMYDAEQNGIVYDSGNTGILCANNAVHGVTLRTAGNASGIRFNTATSGVCVGNYLDVDDNYPIYFNAACPNLRMDDTNVLVTDGTAPASGALYVNPAANAGRGTRFRGSKTHDFGDLATGASESTTVTATGAALGDSAKAWLSISNALVTLDAYVSATNTVTVVATNRDSGNVNLASATLSVEVTRS